MAQNINTISFSLSRRPPSEIPKRGRVASSIKRRDRRLHPSELYRLHHHRRRSLMAHLCHLWLQIPPPVCRHALIAPSPSTLPLPPGECSRVKRHLSRGDLYMALRCDESLDAEFLRHHGDSIVLSLTLLLYDGAEVGVGVTTARRAAERTEIPLVCLVKLYF